MNVYDIVITTESSSRLDFVHGERYYDRDSDSWYRFVKDSNVKEGNWIKLYEEGKMTDRCVCPKCGNNLVIEYIGSYGTIYAIRQDGKIGRRLKSTKYDESSDGYVVYCPSCGTEYDGTLTDEGFKFNDIERKIYYANTLNK